MNPDVANKDVYMALCRFTERVSVRGPAVRLVIDSPTVKQALEAAMPNIPSRYQGGELYGTPVERWTFPFVTLLVPIGEPTQELLEKATPGSILKESDHPQLTAELASSMVAA